jgi:AraC family transcriptional activator of mtrCDE
MIQQPVARISAKDLDILMSTLDVHFLKLTKCFVSIGYGLQLGNNPAPGIHYNIVGCGRAIAGNHPPIDLAPHTMVIVPPNTPFRIEVPAPGPGPQRVTIVDSSNQQTKTDGINSYIAGNAAPEITHICGFFNASYGPSTNLFETLSAPIVEQFSETDRLDRVLKEALAELMTQEVGAGAMSGALLKQVIVALIRRSLTSLNLWVERFSMLRDPQIAQAFSMMVSDPGAPHTIESLSKDATLSRSAFMQRFTDIVGRPPMVVLRDLRMRQAAKQLKTGGLSMHEIIRNAGYGSRSSFIKAFRIAFGCDPSDYKTVSQT